MWSACWIAPARGRCDECVARRMGNRPRAMHGAAGLPIRGRLGSLRQRALQAQHVAGLGGFLIYGHGCTDLRWNWGCWTCVACGGGLTWGGGNRLRSEGTEIQFCGQQIASHRCVQIAQMLACSRRRDNVHSLSPAKGPCMVKPRPARDYRLGAVREQIQSSQGRSASRAP